MTLQEFFDKYNGKGIDFDGAYGFQCLVQSGKFAKVLFGGFVVGLASLFFGGKIPKVYSSVVDRNVCCVGFFERAISNICNAFYFLKSWVVVAILSVCSKAQITLSVVKDVAVNMVDFKIVWSIRYKTMHQNLLSSVFSGSVSTCISSLGKNVPFVDTDPLRVLMVNNGKLAFGKRNQHNDVISRPCI